MFAGIITLLGTIAGIAFFFIKKHHSKSNIKKRRGQKLLKIRDKMKAARLKGDDEEWNRLNAERENLLKMIGKGLAIILVCLCLSGCFVKTVYILQSESKQVWFLNKGDKITKQDNQEITLEKNMVLLSEGYFEELLDAQEDAVLNRDD